MVQVVRQINLQLVALVMETQVVMVLEQARRLVAAALVQRAAIPWEQSAAQAAAAHQYLVHGVQQLARV
jgi:hypothetical protein